MSRKSIFDIMKESTTFVDDLNRLQEIATNDSIVARDTYDAFGEPQRIKTSLYNFLLNVSFDKWKQRGHFKDFKDFYRSIEFELRFNRALGPNDFESILFVIEFYYNLLKRIDIDKDYFGIGNYSLMKTILDDSLANMNYKTKYFEDEEMLIVVEDNPATTAVAEIVDNDFAKDLIRYNHYALKGDLKEKQRILKIMADALEARKDEIKSIDNSFYSDVSFLLNNINIRHNNGDETSSYYHECVDKMSNEELEDWYDETYQMILLAFLRMDNVERARKVTELKRKISGE